MASSNIDQYITQLHSNDPTLTKINFIDHKIDDRGTSKLAAALATNSTLTELSLSNNYMTDIGAESLAAALITNSTLTHLDLNENNIKVKAHPIWRLLFSQTPLSDRSHWAATFEDLTTLVLTELKTFQPCLLRIPP